MLQPCCRAFGNLVQPFIVSSFTTPTWGSTIANAFLIVQVKLLQHSLHTSMAKSCWCAIVSHDNRLKLMEAP